MRKAILALSMMLLTQTGAQAQMIFSPGAIEHLAQTVERLDIEQPEPPPAVIVEIHAPKKRTLKQKAASGVKAAGRKAKAAAKAVGKGAKAAGKAIYHVNVKSKPAVDVVQTGTAIGGAIYFWGKVFGYFKG